MRRDFCRLCFRQPETDESQSGQQTCELVKPIVDGVNVVDRHLSFIIRRQCQCIRCYCPRVAVRRDGQRTHRSVRCLELACDRLDVVGAVVGDGDDQWVVTLCLDNCPGKPDCLG